MKVLNINENNVNYFNKQLDNPNQYVIIKVFAPWCGHCKTLNLIWPNVEKEAKKIKGNGILASITEAMIPHVNCIDADKVPGYPWIFSMKGGSGKKTEFKGNREVKDLIKFIKKKMKKCRTTKTKKKRIGKKKKKTRGRKRRARKRFLK